MNAKLFRFVTASKYMTFVENHKKTEIQVLISVTRRISLPIICGPTKSTPLTENGIEGVIYPLYRTS